MPKAEGMIFEFSDESAIRPELLETIDYDGNKQEILYDTDELSAVCPFSGLPDYGMLSIGYIPNKLIPKDQLFDFE